MAGKWSHHAAMLLLGTALATALPSERTATRFLGQGGLRLRGGGGDKRSRAAAAKGGGGPDPDSLAKLAFNKSPDHDGGMRRMSQDGVFQATLRGSKSVFEGLGSAVSDVQSTFGSNFRSFSQKVYNTRNHLIAGAIGRTLAISIMFPVDTIKTRLQIHGADCCTPLQWKSAVTWPLYAGVSSSLLGQVPNAMLVYGSYEFYKREVAAIFPKLNVTQVRFVSAMLGDLTGSVWLSPFEGTKQRVQAGVYSSVQSAFRGIVRDEGLRGLYRGYSAQVLRDLAYHAIQLPLYEGVKESWLRYKRKGELKPAGGWRKKQTGLDAWESMICGAVAGATSGALTTPLDVVKTRLMTNKGSASGFRGVFVEIWAREGLIGFTAGLRERAVYIALGSAIFWTVFEQARGWLDDEDQRKREDSWATRTQRV